MLTLAPPSSPSLTATRPPMPTQRGAQHLPPQSAFSADSDEESRRAEYSVRNQTPVFRTESPSAERRNTAW